MVKKHSLPRLAGLAGLTVASLTALGPAGPAAAVGPTVGVSSSMEVVRATDSASGRPASASLTAAINEWESFQIVVQGAASDVSVSGDLFGWGETTLSRLAYYTPTERSDAEGDTGRWADIAIPEVDNIYGENRSAFPFDVPAGQNRVVWVDIHVPAGTAPGTYSSSLTVTSAGGSVQVPVSIEVLNYTLPSTSSLKSAFMYTYNGADDQICVAHTGAANCGGDAAKRRLLHSLYSRVALDNRVTVMNGFALRGDQSPAVHGASWETDFEAPLIRGTANLPGGADFRLKGAKVTAAGNYAYVGFHCLKACAEAWKAEANEAGQDWSDRVIWYGCDEPGASQAAWNSCGQSLSLTQSGWTRPALATASIQNWNLYGSTATPSITTLVPILQQMDGRSWQDPNTPGTDQENPYFGDQRSKYNAFAAQAGHDVWIYSACDSFGCAGDTTGSPNAGVKWNLDGWPGYAIDAPANQARAMSWLAERFDAHGELYWSVAERLATAWNDGGAFESGANGDGTLFYPGTVAKIGGTHDIPLESIRLKRLRDGREDYEYMQEIKRLDATKADDVLSIVSGLYPHAYSATAAKDGAEGTAGTLLHARADLIDLLRPLLDDPPDPPELAGRIAYTSDRDGDREIFTMNADGSDPQQLTTNTSSDDFAAWSPDGERIAFTRGNNVWVMNADGGNQTKLTNSAAEGKSEKPAWTPNGKKLVYVVKRPNRTVTDLWIMKVDGSGKRLLAKDPEGDNPYYDPAVAPNGIVYFSKSDRDFSPARIHRVPQSGGAITRVTTGFTDEAVDISPDGAHLTFSRTDKAGTAPYAVMESNIDGSNVVERSVGGWGIEGSAFQSSFGPDSVALTYSSNDEHLDSGDGGLQNDLEIWRIDGRPPAAPGGTWPWWLTDNNASAETNPDWSSPASQ